MLTVLAVTFISSIVAPWWLAITVSFFVSAVVVAAAFRALRKVQPAVDEARERDGRLPYVEVIYPRWFKFADDKSVGLFIAALLLLLCLFLIVATVLMALGFE